MISIKSCHLAISIVLSLICQRNLVGGVICKGCIELDELTFDKILEKFPTTLVKFDLAFPYGKKHDEFAKFALEISEMNVNDLIVGAVGIKSYGDPINGQLFERFKIDDQLPVIKLFVNDDLKQWIDYPKDLNVTTANLRQFVRRRSNLKIIVDDCLEQFDNYATKFMATIAQSSPDSDEASAIINDAQHEITKLETEHSREIAQIYLLMMKRIQERGNDFIGAEQMRLQQLLKEKISNRKKTEINQKLNILSAFVVNESRVSRTEL